MERLLLLAVDRGFFFWYSSFFPKYNADKNKTKFKMNIELKYNRNKFTDWQGKILFKYCFIKYRCRYIFLYSKPILVKKEPSIKLKVWALAVVCLSIPIWFVPICC